MACNEARFWRPNTEGCLDPPQGAYRDSERRTPPPTVRLREEVTSSQCWWHEARQRRGKQIQKTRSSRNMHNEGSQPQARGTDWGEENFGKVTGRLPVSRSTERLGMQMTIIPGPLSCVTVRMACGQSRTIHPVSPATLPTWAGLPHLLTWPRPPAEPAPTCRPRDSSPRCARMVDGRCVTPQNTRARGRLLCLQPAVGWSGLPPPLLSLLASPPVPVQGGMCLLVWGRICGRPQARFHQLSPKLCPTPYVLS